MLDANSSYSQILRRHIKALLALKATYCLEVVGLLAEAACSLLLVDSPAVLAAGFPEEGGWMVAGGLILYASCCSCGGTMNSTHSTAELETRRPSTFSNVIWLPSWRIQEGS